jgi:hypothetical protein
MQRPHFAYLGRSDSPEYARRIAAAEAAVGESKLVLKVVNGDHFTSLPEAINSYIRLIAEQTSLGER